MKTSTSNKTLMTCLLGAVLMAVTPAALLAQEDHIEARPLTHQEIADYALPEGTETSGGLFTVGNGQPVYLEALLVAEDAPVVTNVVWELTAKPAGSTNVCEASPLNDGTNGIPPIYEPRSRLDYVIAGGTDMGRSMLVPTLVGEYEVTATVMADDGSNVVMSCTIYSSDYLGTTANSGCVSCHSGGIASDKRGWLDTGHASFFTEAIDGIKSSHYNEGCIDCHVVGYDTNPLANNGGFDDVAAQVGWSFPTNLTSGNWAAMPFELQKVSNIQCENCHGAGLGHAILFGNTNSMTWPNISVNYNSGDCAQCHSEEPYHVYPLEWENSKHAIGVVEERTSCAGCHQGIGFIDRMDGVSPVRTEYSAINCATCHDPHSAGNPHQLRSLADVTLMDDSREGGNTVVTGGGHGKVCMQCHISRRDAVTYVQGNVSSHFGPHHGPQTDMLVGANAITYGKEIPSSAHYSAVGDTCATCHMHESGSLEYGGHAMWLSWDNDTPEDPSDDVELVDACTQCHGPITTFDFPRQDYDGDGVIEGVRTEVQGLMDQLAMLLPPVGQPEVIVSSSTYTNLVQKQGLYNYLFVEEDGSHGAHNLSYTVGILRASIASLDPDLDKDGLLDEWELATLGTLAYNGNDDVDGDGLNNAMEMGAMTNPNSIDSDGDGFDDLAELRAGSNPNDPSDTPGFFVKMLPAGELEFPSEAAKTYAIQSISDITAVWSNVETNIPGTGGPISRLISTRNGGGQAFYRVVEEAPAP